MRSIRRIDMRRLLMVMVAVLLGPGSAGSAQNYPARAITMIVPFPAGGATDTLARFLAEKMREFWLNP
jgi:tripartite-type tricarboxylate transporter receptor subunit TctC